MHFIPITPFTIFSISGNHSGLKGTELPDPHSTQDGSALRYLGPHHTPAYAVIL